MMHLEDQFTIENKFIKWKDKTYATEFSLHNSKLLHKESASNPGKYIETRSYIEDQQQWESAVWCMKWIQWRR